MGNCHRNKQPDADRLQRLPKWAREYVGDLPKASGLKPRPFRTAFSES